MDAISVKDFGALGDTRSIQDVSITAGDSVVTSAGAGFTNADLGKTVFVTDPYLLRIVLPRGIITEVISATQVRTSSTALFGGITLFLVWGTPDGDAIKAAQAYADGLKFRPVIYFPAGGYLCDRAPALINHFERGALTIRGSNPYNSTLYCIPDDSFINTSYIGQFLNDDGGGALEDIGFNGCHVTRNADNVAAILTRMRLRNVVVQNVWTLGTHCYGIYFNGGGFVDNVFVARCTIGIRAGGAMSWFNSLSSNCGISNVIMDNDADMTHGGGSVFMGGLVDECGSGPSVELVNMHDVKFIGMKIWGGNNKTALKLTNSNVRGVALTLTTYNNAPNVKAVDFDEASRLYLCNSQILVPNNGIPFSGAGTYVDGGSNLIEPSPV